MHRSPRGLLAVAAILGGLGLTACGDTDAPDAAAADCGADAGETVTVEIGDFVFDPTPVAVSRCDEVVWHNGHDQAHTSTGNATQRWNTGNLAPDATSGPIRFEDAGDFTYICALHPFMEWTVQVS
jgi:plastocyanin